MALDELDEGDLTLPGISEGEIIVIRSAKYLGLSPRRKDHRLNSGADE